MKPQTHSQLVRGPSGHTYGMGSYNQSALEGWSELMKRS
jgi:hypothetical protein